MTRTPTNLAEFFARANDARDFARSIESMIRRTVTEAQHD